ncbi:hypothetical protein DXX93_12580 [Thalassotalea euphylliae]|uniref:DUF1835 domain-containing protein n=1 Tax=Thalassotalea euphylliae TaxID=1655234 RepID=A0A3E0TSK5_9GAMM|nr:hypothetical protein [Thalassotalea euphylliae]REL27317.1 hypothetical protein DXX93_12580 [Thalassotalea euphylliae]
MSNTQVNTIANTAVNNLPNAVSSDEHSVIHLLNGDVLLRRFPAEITGEQLVMRECLIDGPATKASGTALYAQRSDYLQKYANGEDFPDYHEFVVPTFDKLMELSGEEAVFCWFEHDLFCQCNLWFCLFLLLQGKANPVYLVQPNQGNEYCYAAMSNAELVTSFERAVPLSRDDINSFAALWLAYAAKDHAQMTAIASRALSHFSFVAAAVNAELARVPDQQGLGEPERVLCQIMHELSSGSKQQGPEFSAVFSEFSRQMERYSFGDLQVKAMFDELRAS